MITQIRTALLAVGVSAILAAHAHGAQRYPARITSRADINATPANHYAIDIVGLQLADYALLSKFVKLRQVSFHLQSGETTDATLEALSKIKKFRVHHVHVSDASSVTDVGVASLLSIPALATMNLDSTAITDESCRRLSQRSSLTGISIVKCDGVTLDGLRQLLGNRSLRLVSFSLGNLDPKTVAALPVSHPWITRWTIVDPDVKLVHLLSSGVQPSGAFVDLRKSRQFPEYP